MPGCRGRRRDLFGPLYQHKEYFWFDDFHLSIETSPGKFTDIPLGDAGFEEDDTAIFDRSWPVAPKRPFFKVAVSTEHPNQGNRCLEIDGSNFIDPFTYGSNDTTGHYVMANGIRLYYEVYGQGRPLLLLHGNSESIISFDKQIPELSKHHRVIAVDTRGQGRSGDGGNTGLIMAMAYPKKVHRLAVMGANVFIDHSVVDRWVFKTIEKQQKELFDSELATDRNRIRLLTLLRTEPRHRFEDLQAIQCPVLVMAGQKDIIKPEHTKQIAAHIPHSQLLIFSGGTHYEPAEHPDVFNKAVEEFLSAP